MAPAPAAGDVVQEARVPTAGALKPQSPNGLVLEAWAQGFLVGALVIMAAITIANMRKGVLLHKLILLELFLGVFHPTFIFMEGSTYGWYLSCTALLLNTSWSLHNVISWLKTRPFLSRKWSIFYITTVVLAQPYWIVEIYANFTFFNNINNLFVHTRPYEALCRDPWWVVSIIVLIYEIHITYKLPLTTIVTISPRFGILFVAMMFSIVFIILDILAVTTNVFQHNLPDGLNPWWKLAMAFKCLTDSIILDDFKTALDRLMRYKMRKDRYKERHPSYTPTLELEEQGDLESGTLDYVRTTETADPLGEDARERLGSGSVEGGIAIDFATALNPTLVSPEERARQIQAMANHVDHWDDIDLPDFQTSIGTSAKSSSKDSKIG